MSENTAPTWKVDLAATGRGGCNVCGGAIGAGTLRVGGLDRRAGTFAWFRHFSCWKPTGVLEAFPPARLAAEVEAFTQTNTSALITRSAEVGASDVALVASTLLAATEAATATEAPAPAPASPPEASRKRLAETPDTAPAAKRQTTAPPVVAVAGPDALKHFLVVITGVFPELGGGCGLHEGKDKATEVLVGSGASVKAGITKAMSKTAKAFVLVGDRPGASKVSKATALDIKLINMNGLRRLLAGELLADVDAAVVNEFSAGY